MPILPKRANQRTGERVELLNKELGDVFPSQEKNGETVFILPDGGVFVLTGHCWGDFGGYGDVVIAESGDSLDSPRTTYEDSGIYCLDEMDLQEMENAIVKDMTL